MNRITSLLGIRYPIIQGGMVWCSGWRLASAVSNATLPYVIALANKGWKKACKENTALALGLNIVEGKIVYKAVADVFGLKYDPISL